MSKNKAEEELKQAKLLFDPDKEAQELNFPAICKFVRESFSVTQSAMAKKLGVQLSAYQYWEYGKREPSSKAAANLCFLYLQCLYMQKQSPKVAEIKQLLDSLLTQPTPDLQKDGKPETVCAA